MRKTHNDVAFQYLCGFMPSSLRVPGNPGCMATVAWAFTANDSSHQLPSGYAGMYCKVYCQVVPVTPSGL
jgi:hypothetical protein